MEILNKSGISLASPKALPLIKNSMSGENYQFNIKVVDAALFGLIEAEDQAPWKNIFSASHATIPIKIDETTLETIAEDLGISAYGIALEASLYVNGKYHPKAGGITSSILGDLGEILSYLLNSEDGRQITRVTNWSAAKGQKTKDAKFPMPDFIILDDEGNAAALEVKSTDVFDFIKLQDKANKWKFLQPCNAVAGRRQEALSQLGFVGVVPAPQRHQLVLKDNKIVPFPVGKGVVNVVLAFDGRMNGLRTDPRFRTPPECRVNLKHECWNCVSQQDNFILVKMPNSPGQLSLAGSAESGNNLMKTFSRWSMALMHQDLIAFDATSRKLVSQLRDWFRFRSESHTDLIRKFWHGYLTESANHQGMVIDVGAISREDDRFEGNDQKELRGTVPIEKSFDEVSAALNSSLRDGENAAFTFQPAAEGKRATCSVRLENETIEFLYFSETWWSDARIETENDASFIARELLIHVLKLIKYDKYWWRKAYLREMSVEIEGKDTLIGWEWRKVKNETQWLQPMWDDGPRWLSCLPRGLGNVKCKVRPDGRASLKIPILLWSDE